MTDEKILDKIKKCLAMAKSSNPTEAQTALRQARKLMDIHKLDLTDVHVSMVNEVMARAGDRPADWMRMLASTCAHAFGCELITAIGCGARFHFIGVDSAPELSKYAFEVLHRQLKAARSEYVQTLSRCKLATKRRKGEIFAQGWILSVHRLISEFAGVDEKDIAAIEAYKAQKYPDLTTSPLKVRKVTQRDDDARLQGFRAGKSAKLHQAMGADKRTAIGHMGVDQ